MSEANDLVRARLSSEEGTKLLPYDDATGEPVKAPIGHVSWGRGFDLEECGSADLFDLIEWHLIEEVEQQLLMLPWYRGVDSVRQSVCLDIAYNDGTSGLLAFHNMIDAIQSRDWPRAAAECHVKNPQLAARYEALARLLLSG